MTSSTPSSRKLFSDELELRLDEVLFASPSHRSAKNIADGLERLGREQQERVLHWVAVAAQSYAEIGYLVATLAPRALDRLDASGFEAWVLAGLDAYDRQGGQAAMALLRDLDGFCAAREHVPAAARLADVESRLSRFLQGLSGRALALSHGAFAHTDTETVFLPAQLAALPTAADNRRLYKAMAALLWAQTRHGTFGSAALDIEAALARWADRERALRWFATLEAVRLEAVLGAELPGLAAEIAALRGPWPTGLEEAVRRLSRPDAAVSQTLTFLAECMAGEDEPPQLAHAGAIDIEAALRVRAARIAREAETVRRALSTLKGFGGRQGAGEEAPAVNIEGGRVEFSLDGEVAALPPEARAAAQSLLQDLGELPPECLVPAGPGAWQPTQREGDEGGGENALTSHREPHRRYDEWDYRRRAYRRGWCHLFEVDLAPGDADYVAKVSLRNTAAIRQIRRRFEMLRGEDRLLGRQPEGEEVDIDALVEAAGDRASGAEPSARLFCRRIRNERSLAAMFMVDMSGSTKGWVNDAERESLVMLCEALETLGDAYAIYGFSGWTRTRCDIYPVKRFDERYDATVRGRIAAIEAKDYTRMGVAIRHLTQLLEAQPARHKLLVTLSDGRPDDFGDEYRGHYGIEDTRRALQEAHERGVRSYCVTIDRHGADYLPRLYGPARYAVLDDVWKLPLKVADIYRRLAT
ncbi:MAG: nitric oxide reductase activation protein [Rhodocyclales bacterium]|nr:nitric oxide reductase activation protein [Rhodocyclales bacterium]